MSGAPTDDRLFEAAFRGSLDALFLVDDDCVVIEANQAATELSGLDSDALVGESLSKLAASSAEFESQWGDLLETGRANETFEYRRSDGAVLTVTFVGRTDIVPGVHLVALRNVSDATPERADLERKVAVYSRLFETSPVGIVVVNRDGDIVEANRRAESVLGLQRDELTGRTYDDPEWKIADGDGNPIADEDLPVAQVLSTGRPVFGFEHSIERPDGTATWLSVNATPIYESGAVEQVIATVEDVTERREYERMLELQNERLEEYSATVSHDLRGPMSVASGWVDVAMEEGSTEDLDKVKTALARMNQLVDDLRSLGRYGQTVRGPEELELRAVAEQAWMNLETEDATLVFDDELGVVEAEQGRLLQLFENLYRNSVDHAGPEVTVRLGTLQNGFYVEDDGPGIPAHEREAVLDYGYSTQEGGTGLGLAIVEAVADAHGWDLHLTDADPQGARFEFRRRWHPDVDT